MSEVKSGLRMKYFVLKPSGNTTHNHASRAALYAYADAVEEDNVFLANDLRTWASQEIARTALGDK